MTASARPPDEHRVLDGDRLAIGEAQAPDQHDRVSGRIASAARLGLRGGTDLPARAAASDGVAALARASRARTPSGGRRAGARAARPRTCRARGSRTTRPSSARRCMALRAVIRLTPNSRHRSLSDGSRSPGRSVAMRSRSASSIWR